MKVLVSDVLSERGTDLFRSEEGIDVVVKTGMPKEELLKEIGDFEGLIIRSNTKVDSDVIKAGKKLRVIGRAGIGVDNVDLESASKKGIVVMNTPEGNIVTTAEHAISMMLSLARNIPSADVSIKNGKWEKKGLMGVEVYKKTLGVIGLGRIGRIVADRARGLAMKVIAYDPFISLDAVKELGVEPVELDELFARSDFITLHVPKSDNTKKLLGKEEFAKMKTGIRIINCARGGLIDEAALYDAVQEGKVAGAALDVFEKEPPEDSPLLKLKDVICTPHLGASTQEAQENVAVDIAEQIIDFLKTGKIKNAVNAPSVDAETLEKIGPYIDLGEKLGGLMGHLIEGGVKDLKVKYSGEIVKYDLKPVTVSVLRGLLTYFLKEDVNMINAPAIAKERGIEVEETQSNVAQDFASLVHLEVTTDSETRIIEGTIFGRKDARIVRLDDYILEAIPRGNMLVVSNHDSPGVIGKIGITLGNHQINIAGFHLSRITESGKALSIINIDSSVEDNVLEEIKKLKNVIYAKRVFLP